MKRDDCYAMVITDACADVDGVRHRMPVILRADDWATRLEGDASAVEALCQPGDGAGAGGADRGALGGEVKFEALPARRDLRCGADFQSWTNAKYTSVTVESSFQYSNTSANSTPMQPSRLRHVIQER